MDDFFTIEYKSSPKQRLRYDLQFFANDEGGEKTEEPTGKKLEDSRKEGQVAQSKEIVTGVTLLSAMLSIKFLIGYVGNRFFTAFRYYYGKTGEVLDHGFDIRVAVDLLADVLIFVLLTVLPFLLIGLIVGFLVTKVQFKWMITMKPLMPKFSKLNPINGFKRIFSMQSLMNLLISVLKIVLVGWVAYSTVMDDFGLLYRTYDLSIEQTLGVMFDVIMDVGIKAAVVLCLVGATDLFYQRWKHHKDLKMTKQEVKDEFKNSEGDPKVKGQQKQRMQQAAQRRMMQSVPQADVVITNPTHFAVALKYDPNIADAPVVTAKGADFLAAKIKDVAKENNVMIVENKPLARMLYNNVELDAQIPPELYQMVADVLAYVYSLEKRVG